MYEINFTGRSKKQFLKLDPQTRGRVADALDEMEDWPNWALDIAPLRGRLQGSFRLRVGDYRVIFTVDQEEETISIAAIAPRGSAYR